MYCLLSIITYLQQNLFDQSNSFIFFSLLVSYPFPPQKRRLAPQLAIENIEENEAFARNEKMLFYLQRIQYNLKTAISFCLDCVYFCQILPPWIILKIECGGESDQNESLR